MFSIYLSAGRTKVPVAGMPDFVFPVAFITKTGWMDVCWEYW